MIKLSIITLVMDLVVTILRAANNMGIVILAAKVEGIESGSYIILSKLMKQNQYYIITMLHALQQVQQVFQIGGAIDAVTSITGSGDIAIATDKFTLDSTTGNAVFGGNITGGGNFNATTGTTFQLGSTASAKLGIGRAAATYNLEVEGSIYSTASQLLQEMGLRVSLLSKRCCWYWSYILPIILELMKRNLIPLVIRSW